MERKLGRLFVVLAAVLALACLITLFWPASTAPTARTMPNPNGYVSLVRAEEMIKDDFSDVDSLNQESLRMLVDNNTNALQLARVGLQQESLIPIRFSEDYWKQHSAELTGSKRLAWALIAQGRLAEMEKRPADAAKCYLDTIHLGIKFARGGMMIDSLVGIAIEAMGTRRLQTLVAGLDAGACRQAAGALESWQAEREPWTEVLKREHEWFRAADVGLRERLSALIHYRETRKAEAKAESRLDTQELETVRLAVELAARAYELEKGSRPADIAALVPDYLKAVPVDPTAGTNMVSVP